MNYFGITGEQLDQAVPMDVVRLEHRRAREVHEVRDERMRRVAGLHETVHVAYPDGELFMSLDLLYQLNYIELQQQAEGQCEFSFHETLPTLRIRYREGRIRIGGVISDFTSPEYIRRLTGPSIRRLERHLHQLVTEASPTGCQLLENTMLIRYDTSSKHHLDAHGGSRLCNSIKLFEFCLLAKYEAVLGKNYNPFGMHPMTAGNQTYPNVYMNIGNINSENGGHSHVTYGTVESILEMVSAEDALRLGENEISHIGELFYFKA